MVLDHRSTSRWPASVENGAHVGARLFVRRNAVVPPHGAGPGVVGGHPENGPELVGETAQVGDAGIDVLPGVEGIRHAEVELRAGHQLHQALGSGRRLRVRTVARLDGDDGVHQVGVDTVPSCSRVDDVGEPLFAGLGREREETGAGGDKQGEHEATAGETRRHAERKTLSHPRAERASVRHRLHHPGGRRAHPHVAPASRRSPDPSRSSPFATALARRSGEWRSPACSVTWSPPTAPLSGRVLPTGRWRGVSHSNAVPGVSPEARPSNRNPVLNPPRTASCAALLLDQIAGDPVPEGRQRRGGVASASNPWCGVDVALTASCLIHADLPSSQVTVAMLRASPGLQVAVTILRVVLRPRSDVSDIDPDDHPAPWRQHNPSQRMKPEQPPKSAATAGNAASDQCRRLRAVHVCMKGRVLDWGPPGAAPGAAPRPPDGRLCTEPLCRNIHTSPRLTMAASCGGCSSV